MANKADRKPKKIFPFKLWDLIHHPHYGGALQWSEDGKTILLDLQKLQDLCLGKGKTFYTTKTKSFVRNLHLYGFKKIGRYEFTHKYFRRGRFELLEKIKRTYEARTQSTSSSPSPSSSNQENNQNMGSEENQPVSSSNMTRFDDREAEAKISRVNNVTVVESNQNAQCQPDSQWSQLQSIDCNQVDLDSQQRYHQEECEFTEGIFALCHDSMSNQSNDLVSSTDQTLNETSFPGYTAYRHLDGPYWYDPITNQQTYDENSLIDYNIDSYLNNNEHTFLSN